MNSICGLDCSEWPQKDSCAGCVPSKGRPFHGTCVAAQCCQSKGYTYCRQCTNEKGACRLKEQLIAEFNALGIADMEEVTDLNLLKGSFVNLPYTIPNGQVVKLWDDDRIYWGNQLCKKDSNRCYGLAADEHYLLVCEYGDGGSDAEIVVYKRRQQ